VLEAAGRLEHDERGREGEHLADELRDPTLVVRHTQRGAVGQAGEVEHGLADVDADEAVHPILQGRRTGRRTIDTRPHLAGCGLTSGQLFGLAAIRMGWRPG
jgi:hypothetical protein